MVVSTILYAGPASITSSIASFSKSFFRIIYEKPLYSYTQGLFNSISSIKEERACHGYWIHHHIEKST
ncbi:hypothetical protein QPL79_04155 [Ignisphaera sp. 4213-co]|uniref:Uncharacterized protein n=1 Tax=Ignisphaera cupida TaxID=3050454 RepID=A0ABD4Z5G7_9CREN|nr:hypothetical protein [Ignisphaera sp. 4213-co]MDK6028546.1 hypothetical protein [Ignisphaera sp. 4213-co]